MWKRVFVNIAVKRCWSIFRIRPYLVPSAFSDIVYLDLLPNLCGVVFEAFWIWSTRFDSSTLSRFAIPNRMLQDLCLLGFRFSQCFLFLFVCCGGGERWESVFYVEFLPICQFLFSYNPTLVFFFSPCFMFFSLCILSFLMIAFLFLLLFLFAIGMAQVLESGSWRCWRRIRQVLVQLGSFLHRVVA